MEFAAVAYLISAIWHGGAVPLFWVIGAVLLVVAVVTAIRGAILLAVLLFILGVVLGGLNLF